MYVLSIVILIIILILWFSRRESFLSKASGNESYVRFFGDFNYNDMIFEMKGSEQVKYFKYIWRGDIRSLDINLLENGGKRAAEYSEKYIGPRRVQVWAYRFWSPTETTLSDFYNIYQIPEHVYKAHPNLQLVADIHPGERFRTDDVPFAKRFLLRVVM